MLCRLFLGTAFEADYWNATLFGEEDKKEI
jgi:hypothetical protein